MHLRSGQTGLLCIAYCASWYLQRENVRCTPFPRFVFPRFVLSPNMAVVQQDSGADYCLIRCLRGHQCVQQHIVARSQGSAAGPLRPQGQGHAGFRCEATAAGLAWSSGAGRLEAGRRRCQAMGATNPCVWDPDHPGGLPILRATRKTGGSHNFWPTFPQELKRCPSWLKRL
jgi:hypothetical protein